MTRYLLDTNIISNMIKPEPSTALAAWMLEQRGSDLFVASWTMAEIRRGILCMPQGRRRDRLEEWFASEGGPVEMFAGRILPFDEQAALAYATLPFRRASYDRLIAAHALALDVTLVTANERDFADIQGLRVENWIAA